MSGMVHGSNKSHPARKKSTKFRAVELPPQSDQQIISGQHKKEPAEDNPHPRILLSRITPAFRLDDGDFSFNFQSLSLDPPTMGGDGDQVVRDATSRRQRKMLAQQHLASLSLQQKDNLMNTQQQHQPQQNQPPQAGSKEWLVSSGEGPFDDAPPGPNGEHYSRISPSDRPEESSDSSSDHDSFRFIPSSKRRLVKSSIQEQEEREEEARLEHELQERRAHENTADVLMSAQLLELQLERDPDAELPDDSDEMEMEMVDIAEWRRRECRRLLNECKQRLVALGQPPNHSQTNPLSR